MLKVIKVVAIYSIISTKISIHTLTFYWPIFCNISSNLGSDYLMMGAAAYFVKQIWYLHKSNYLEKKQIHTNSVYFPTVNIC